MASAHIPGTGVEAAAEPQPGDHDFSRYGSYVNALNTWLEKSVFARGGVTVSAWADKVLTRKDALRVNLYVGIAGEFDESNVGEIMFRTSGGDIHAAVTTHVTKKLGSGARLTLPTPASVTSGNHGIGKLPQTSAEFLKLLAQWLSVYMHATAEHVHKLAAGPVTAAAEPRPRPAEAVPHISVILDTEDADDVEDEITASLRRFGFVPADTNVSNETFGEGDTGLVYHACDISYHGKPEEMLRHFQAWLKFMFDNQDRMHVQIDREWLAPTAHRFAAGTDLKQHRVIDTVVVGAAEPAKQDLFSRGDRDSAIHVRVAFVAPDDVKLGDVDDYARYQVQGAAKASLRSTNIHGTYVYVDMPVSSTNPRVRYLVYNWAPESVPAFRTGLHKFAVAITAQFPDIDVSDIARFVVDAVRHGPHPDPARGYLVVTCGIHAVKLPHQATAAAEPGGSTSRYRHWFEQQIRPESKFTDVRLRYRGMDLTLSRKYTADKNALRYGVYCTGPEPAFTIDFNRAGALLRSTYGDVTAAASPDFQRTMLHVLDIFDKQVQEHIQNNLGKFRFYERTCDVHGGFAAGKLTIKVTKPDGSADSPGPELEFTEAQLRQWLWSPGRVGWHETLLREAAEAWKSYKYDKGL